MPVCSRQGKRTVGGDRPVQHRAEHREHLEERGTHFHDRPEYDKKFQETVKIYEQGKKYYDALKSVNNLVKDARKVQQTILMVGDITDTYVTSFQKMMRDDNFTVEELGAIAFGYTKLLEESQRCADGTEECGEYHHALHDGQGAHGRGGTLLLQNEALPQPRELLHQQEH